MFNRRGLYEGIRRKLNASQNQEQRAFMIFADLDSLKIINDRFGHEEGDFAIRSAASSAVYYLAIIGIPLYCGFFGLEHYRKKVKSDILRIRSECSDMNTYQIMLQKEGGTSAGGAIIGILIYLTAMLCYSYVPMLIALLYF